ncbi:MAG: HupE/UreJ family protein [Deltaproteobacteria bacterium]|nr:HupE/UreJ family protein [Deltaproteobacteria bacterium]
MSAHLGRTCTQARTWDVRAHRPRRLVVHLRPRCALLFALALLALASAARAHEARPLYVEVRESARGELAAQWRIPASVPRFDLPDVELSGCMLVGDRTEQHAGDAILRAARFRCTSASPELAVRYPLANPSIQTLIRFTRANGEVHTALLSPEESRWTPPALATKRGVAAQYMALGARHIADGVDHLLFLACLLLLARTPRRVVVTVTGFTLAHSVTLAASALDVVRLPSAPVETVIALSVVFVASELARAPRASLTRRAPVAVSSSFGLLHGFGFAGALREIGLPQTEIPTALLAFNAGVELGQLAFVAAAFALAALARRAWRERAELAALLPRAERAAAFGVGCLAAYWTVERVASFAAR